MIGVAIVTYERPQRLAKCWPTVWNHLRDVTDVLYAWDDGSTSREALAGYAELRNLMPFSFESGSHGHCAVAKNNALRYLMDAGCDHLFLCEDDMLILDPRAVTGYIDVAERTGIEHFSFAKHGPCNLSQGLIERRSDGVETWPCSVGAWTYFTRNVIETVGYLDEGFDSGALEHVEHTWRISRAGLTTPMWQFADVTGSERWIRQQDDCWTSSTFAGKDNEPNVHRAKAYWNAKWRDELGGDFWT